MIRRWSYLNNINHIFFEQYRLLNFVHYEQSFKMNIVFRKEINYISTISRKSWSRRKHLTNWLIYQNVLTDWSKDYLFFKKYNRFILIFQLFKNNFFSYNNFLIKKLNVSSTSGSETIVFSSLTSKIIRYCSKNFNQFYMFLHKYKNINWLYVTTPQYIDNNPSLIANLANPIFASSQTLFNLYTKSNELSIWFWVIYKNLFTNVCVQLLTLYKISILLCLPLLQ
jgi:hypothetical protein